MRKTGGTQTVPKEVRFEDEQVKKAAKGEVQKEDDGKRDSNEMEIEFITEPPVQDDMSALSRSIGKHGMTRTL